jgi:hypothetical protein
MSKITFPGGNGGGGGGAGVSDHGGLAGLGDDDHTQYLLTDGTRDVGGNLIPDASGSHSLGVSSRPFASGIFDDGFWIRGQDDGQSPGFDRNGWNIRTIAMNGSLTNIEANSLIASTGGSILFGSTRGGFTAPADGNVDLHLADGTTSGTMAMGNLYAETQIYISGMAVGDMLGGGGGAADFSSVAEPILPDTSGIRDIGSFTKVWASGFFDGIVLADNDPAGTLWKITVDSAGTLTTTQVSG